jgi:glycosyltransferase involved in cell wall biosynthesis
MRVAVFTDIGFDATNGTTTALRAVVAHAPDDLRPRVYTFSDLEVDEPDYRAFRTNLLPRVWQIRRELAKDDVGVVHMASAGRAGFFARCLAVQAGLPIVGSVHDADCGYGPANAHPPNFARRRYLKWMYAGCHQILVPSACAARRLAALGWGRDRAIVWPRGVDPGVFTPNHRSERLRETWRVSDRRPAILVAGCLSAAKGLALIEPLGSLLHRQRIAHRFIVLGSGPMLVALKERCPDAVFTGRVVHAEVPRVMASADILVYPSQAGSGCSVLLEAQASGLPVVAVRAGSAIENMCDGRTGYACRAGDVTELGARVAVLLVDREHRQTLRASARAYACSRSWQSSLETVYATYRSALDAASRPQSLSTMSGFGRRPAGQR